MPRENGNLEPPELLTIQQAADLLNVSRTYLVEQILQKAHIPAHGFGTQRKIFLRDVVAYMQQRDIQTDEAMANLAALSQELNIVSPPATDPP